MQIFLLIIVSFCEFNCEIVGSKAPKVETGNGWIVGKTFKTSNLVEFDGFLGIPFAKPPVGNLRLRDPEPFTDKFTEHNPYLATEEKTFCIQKNYLLQNPFVMGVEDCLYLYVYRPKSIRKCQRPLPVIVYIHGGAFFAGYAGPSFTGADYFMDTEDVIFVTMSYRLGPLGFLSTGDDNMSGNFGLKDQAMAMKWVKENIGRFGGDPNNISLMGQSAGASSVHLHMMSDMSKNLFNKAIMLSGNGIAPYLYVLNDPLQQARDFANAAGIQGAQGMSISNLTEELRNVDVTKLLDATDSFKIWSIDPLVISKPVIEDCSTTEGFLCDNPVKMWKNGNYSRVPFITGIMNGDGGFISKIAGH
ncbi:juvenile hormone esterase-like [Chironomus tepperi]|uniref:juvenile hormone esterase-like n=1 Tax=Chironomus tepperi TaxID=113505 RepID=UPI00391F3A36